MRFEAARARAYYDESRPLLDLIHPRSRPSLWALIAIYSRPAGAHREQQLRRVPPTGKITDLGEGLDCSAGVLGLRPEAAV